MGRKLLLCLCLLAFNLCTGSPETDVPDGVSFNSLASGWNNKPSNWVGFDPCIGSWVGIKCNGSLITSIEVSSMGIGGSLTGDIGGLTELETLDLSYNADMGGSLPPDIGKLRKLTHLILVGCNFIGVIPDLSGLQELVYLSLNLNKFSGSIPPSIGSLSKLYWLDLADNMLTGPIPISNGTTPGLDQLIHTKHFHLGNNRFSGIIPPQLFSSKTTLIHLLLDNNQLEGSIPSTLGLVQNLEVVRLDRNKLSGSVPANINNLTKVGELYLSNNKLTGPLPDLTGMSKLNYVDLSNNSFDSPSVPAWFSSLESLTTLIAEFLRIEGQLPADIFSFPQMQTLRLRNNLLNGTVTITKNYSSQLQLVDLRFNKIEYLAGASTYDRKLMLQGNPYCQDGSEKYCMPDQVQSSPSYTTPLNCGGIVCPSGKDLSPKCTCAYPYTGIFYFRAPSFSNLDNSTQYQALEEKLTTVFFSVLQVDYSVFLYNITWNPNKYLQIGLKVFPSNASSIIQSEIPVLGFILSNQTFKPPPGFGPFTFQGFPYKHFGEGASESKSKTSNLTVIIGVAAGVVVLLVIIVVLVFYGCRQRRRAETAEVHRQPFATWDRSKTSGDVPQLAGARCFSFDELKNCTNNFSEANVIGSGGYGKVYRGVLEDGQLVAVKRAEQKSMQGGMEFKTEIELLSRVHHRNLVRLVGFCFDKVEQMLVYEYIPNGSLRDSLAGKSGVRLDWRRRLRVALGSARGLAYLHELADPPIVHRDVKSSNILLDDQLAAKVADFGLCKALQHGSDTHVTTQVKGTMGYMDPEYYMTQQLTEKSDVYSFGVLMLELLTARPPIERGRYIVREVKARMNKSGDLYGLHELLDPNLVSSPNLAGFEKFVDLALRCFEELGMDRPPMSEVVKEIEDISRLVGINPNMDSNPSSASYGESGSYQPHQHPYDDEGVAVPVLVAR